MKSIYTTWISIIALLLFSGAVVGDLNAGVKLAWNMTIFNSTYPYNAYQYNDGISTGYEQVDLGIRNEATNFTGNGANLWFSTTDEAWCDNTNDDFTIVLWANTTETTIDSEYFFGAKDDTLNDIIQIYVNKNDPSAYLTIRNGIGTGSNCESGILRRAMLENKNHMWVGIFNNTNNSFQLWMNDTKMCSGTQSDVACPYDDLLFGNHRALGAGNELDGSIDEVILYDRALSPVEVGELWNLGAGAFFPFAGAPVTVSLKVNASNSTYPHIKRVFGEGENFGLYANYTMSNETIVKNGVCNFTVYDGIRENESGTDYTLCNTGCTGSSYTTTFKNSNTLLSSQSLAHVEVCHSSLAQGDLEINISCFGESYAELIAPSAYTTCDVGYTKIFINSSVCIDSEFVNVTLTSDVIYNRRKSVTETAYDRVYSELRVTNESETFFNTTNNIYQTTSHWLEIYEHGTTTIDGNCTLYNGSYPSSQQISIVIENAPPLIVFEDIEINGTTYPLNGSSVNYENGTWNFQIALIDDDIDSFNITLANATGNLTSIDSGVLSVSSDVFRGLGVFNVTVWVNDTEGEKAQSMVSFNVTDIITPYCTGWDNSQVLYGKTYNFNVQCIDEAIFSFNLSCTNGMAYYREGLNDVLFTFTNTTTMNQTFVCSYYVCDGHTKNKIKKEDWAVRIKDKKIEFDRLDRTMSFYVMDANKDVDLEYTVMDDKVKFKVTDKEKKALGDIWFRYETSSRSYNLDSNSYPAWIVDPASRTWFDLRSNGTYEYKVVKWNSTTWDIFLRNLPPEVEFESIGELNCIAHTQTISRIVASETIWGSFLAEEQCPLDKDLSYVLGYFILMVLAVALYVINIGLIRYPFIGILCGLGLVALSLPLYNCSWLFGTVVTVLGLLLGVSELRG